MPIGVAGAVPVLVMVTDDRHHRIREIDRGKNLRADRGMELHLLELGRRELAGLVQDVLRHGDLPGVVQQRRGLDRLQRLFVGDTDLARQRERARPARAGCVRA